MSLPPDSETAGQADRARWHAFAVCLGAGFMALLDVSIVNVALPSIEDALDAGPSDLQWIVAGYSLAFGLMLVPAGRVGDVLGRRRLFVGGLIAFVIFSAACGMAPSAGVLALCRLLQGLSAGTLNPQVVGLIQQLFSGSARARAFGYFGATIGLSTATGPLVGGLLIAAFGQEHGWRAVFLVNVPIGLLLIPLALRYLPGHDRRPAGRVDIDVVGLVLLGAAVVCVMLPFVVASEAQGDAPWWTVAVGLACGGLFAWWERRLERVGGSPVLPAALVRTPSFAFGVAVGTAYFAGFTGLFLLSTLYLQQGLQLTPLQAGLTLTSFALCGALSAARSGRMVQRFGRWTVVGGATVMIVGMVGVDLVAGSMDGPRTPLVIAACLAVAGLGNGNVVAPNQTLTLADVPVERGGSAGGVLQTAQRVGASVGIAVVAAVFFSNLGSGGLAGGYGEAMSAGLRVNIALLCVAVVAAGVDALRRRRREPG